MIMRSKVDLCYASIQIHCSGESILNIQQTPVPLVSNAKYRPQKAASLQLHVMPLSSLNEETDPSLHSQLYNAHQQNHQRDNLHLRALDTGALMSLRSFTPSTICFMGVPWPAAMLLARPRRCRIASRAASRSKGSLFNDNSPSTGVRASEAAWATVEGVIGPRPGLKAGVAGEKAIGIVVVVVRNS